MNIRPRYTHRSNRFIQSPQGKWLPAHPDDGANDDGAVSSSEALKDMQYLKAYAKTHSAQELYQKRLTFWKALREHMMKKEKQKVGELLKSLLKSKDPKVHAMIRDAFDIIKTNEPHLAQALPPLSDFGMIEISASQSQFATKLQLIAKYPQWKPYLEDPATGINLLFQKKDYQTLRSIADVIEDAEFAIILAKKLGELYRDPFDQQEIRKTVKGIIEQGRPIFLMPLAEFTFSDPNTKTWEKKELTLLIESTSSFHPVVTNGSF